MKGFKLSDDGKILYGFEGKCPSEIKIPESVITIEKDAFAGCEALTKVEFNKVVKTVKSGAFSKTGIKTVSLPASVKSLSVTAFSYMTMGRQNYGQPYETPSELKIDKNNPYYFTDGKCLYKITEDKKLVLLRCFKASSLSVSVIDGTVKIAKKSFGGCKYLKSVELPNSLITIEDKAFIDSPLETLNLPASTISLGKSELSYLTLNIKGPYDTYYCSYSTKIEVDINNPVYASDENCFMKKEDGRVTLLHIFDKNIKEFTVPENVTHISSGAFNECSKMKKINFPDSLEVIGENAFKRCICLEDVAFPEKLKNIENGAFSNCTKLRYVTLKGEKTKIGKDVFEGCKKNLILFSFPEGFDKVKFAKENNIKIESETNKADNSISAFTYTVSKNKTVKLTAYKSRENNVIIPSEIEGFPVVAFNKDLFKNNKKITSVVWPAEIPVIPKELFFGCSSLKEITLPDGVTEIQEKAFRNCESLTEMIIPSSVKTIHEKAFECAKNTVYGWEYWNCLKTIVGESGSYASTFANNAKITFVATDASDEEREALSRYAYHKVDDGISLDDFTVTSDMPVAKNFYGTVLEAFSIPNEILGIPVVELSKDFHKSAKQHNSNEIEYDKIAKELIIPKNLKRIRCPLDERGITSVSVSPENKNIIFDDYAWYEDGGKTIVSIWIDNVYSIKEYTIRDGTVQACEEMDQKLKLNKLVFPDSFRKIHKKFLKTASSWATVEKIYANYNSCMREYAEEIDADFIALDRTNIVFSDDGKALINCPQGFSETVYTLPDTVTSIKEYAFMDNEYIKEIIIPDSVTEIEEGAFSGCIALESVKLPDALSVLPDMLFNNCKNLKTVNMPSNVVCIGKKCFFGTALEKIIIPETVTEIGDCAFGTNSWHGLKIKSIELPKSVRNIGNYVCSGIKNITVYDSIDPDAKSAKDFYDDSFGCCNSKVGYIGKSFETYTITVKSAIDGTVKYEVLMYGEEEARNVYCAMVSSWGKNAEFNFARIDEKFSKLTNAENRLHTVINRLKYPIDLSKEAEEKYVAWLRRNVSGFVENEDLEHLVMFEKYGIITKSNIKKLVDLAFPKGNAELNAYLLDYQSKL